MHLYHNRYNFIFYRMIIPYFSIVEEIYVNIKTNHIGVSSFFVNKSGLELYEYIEDKQ